MSSLVVILVCLIATTKSAVLPGQIQATILPSPSGQNLPTIPSPTTGNAGQGNSGIAIPFSIVAAADDTPSEIMKDMAEKVDDAAGAVVDVIQDAKDKVADVISDVKDQVDDVISNVKDKVEDVVDTAQDVVSDVVENASEAAEAVNGAAVRGTDDQNDDGAFDDMNEDSNETVEVKESTEIINDDDAETEDGVSKNVEDDNVDEENESSVVADESDDSKIDSDNENQSQDDMLETVLDIITDFNSQLNSGEVNDASRENDDAFEEHIDNMEDMMDERTEQNDNDDDTGFGDSDVFEGNSKEDEADGNMFSWFANDDDNEINKSNEDKLSQFIGKMSRAKSYMNALEANIAAAKSIQDGTCPVYPVSVTTDRITITTKDGCNIVIRLKGVGIAGVDTFQDNLTDRRVPRLVEVSYHGDD